MVYCAGIDIAIEEYIKHYNEELQAMSWEEKAHKLADLNYDSSDIMLVQVT